MRFLAGKFANRGEHLEDLIQVGSIGLVNAVDRFDPERETKFSTYATPTIVGEIRRHFRDKGWSMKVPRRLQELNQAASKATEKLTQDLGREPTIEEIAKVIGTSEDETNDAILLGNVYDTVSLDTKLAYESESAPLTLAEFVGAVDGALQSINDYADLQQALDCLEERERAIIRLRFFKDLSQTEVAKRLGISQMHVSRLQARALMQLKEILMGYQRHEAGNGKKKMEEVSPVGGSNGCPVLSSEEIRVVVNLWPSMAGEKPYEINVGEFGRVTDMETSRVYRVIGELVKKQIILGKHDTGYTRGSDRFTADFPGSETWNPIPGIELQRGASYSLNELLVGRGGEEKVEVETEVPKQRIIPLVSPRSVRVATIVWALIKKDEFTSLSPQAIANQHNFKFPNHVRECLTILKKVGVLVGGERGEYMRGDPFVAIPDPSVSPKGQPDPKPLEVFNLDTGENWREEVPVANIITVKTEEVEEPIVGEQETAQEPVVEEAVAPAQAEPVEVSQPVEDLPAVEQTMISTEERVAIGHRKLRVILAIWNDLSYTEPRPIDFKAVGEALDMERAQVDPEVMHLTRFGILTREGKGQYKRGNSKVVTKFRKPVTRATVASGIEIVDGQEFDIDELVRQIAATKGEPIQEAPQPAPEPVHQEPHVEEPVVAPSLEVEPVTAPQPAAEIEVPSGEASVNAVETHLEAAIAASSALVEKTKATVDQALERYHTLKRQLDEADQQVQSAREERDKAVATHEKLLEAKKAIR